MRAAQSGLVLSLGMVQMVGNLYTPESTESKKEVKFRNCCKACYEAEQIAVPISLVNTCEHGHGPFGSDGVIKGKEEDGGIISIVGTSEEVKEAKATTIEAKRIDLVVHNADDVDAVLFPGEGSAYVFLPTGPNDFYHVLIALMDDDGRILCDDGVDRVLIGALRVRDSEHLVRLTKWNGHLVIKSMLRPEQLKEFPVIEPKEITDKNLTMGRQLIAMQTEDFDVDNYKDENRERLAQWVAARRSGVTVSPQPSAKKGKPSTQDLDELLAQAVAAAAAKAS